MHQDLPLRFLANILHRWTIQRSASTIFSAMLLSNWRHSLTYLYPVPKYDFIVPIYVFLAINTLRWSTKLPLPLWETPPSTVDVCLLPMYTLYWLRWLTPLTDTTTNVDIFAIRKRVRRKSHICSIHCMCKLMCKIYLWSMWEKI